MKVRRWALFDTNIPADDFVDEEDDCRLDGKNVAEAISSILRKFECEVSAPNYVDEHGWELDIVCGGRKLWAQVVVLDKCIFVLEDCSLISGFFHHYHPNYLDALKRLGEALATDKRFRNVRWHDDPNFPSGREGARPVED